MHAKYEVSISNGSKVIANVKVDNRQTNKQTGQKQYAPNHSIRGHKKLAAQWAEEWAARGNFAMQIRLPAISK